MQSNARAHVIVSGRVQGVFFRAETQKTARNLGLAGWVRNRADGTVEALFEGARAEVERAIAWCRQGSPRAQVTDVNVTWQEYSGEFNGFTVRS
jgi:acylphosphatase